MDARPDKCGKFDGVNMRQHRQRNSAHALAPPPRQVFEGSTVPPPPWKEPDSSRCPTLTRPTLVSGRIPTLPAGSPSRGRPWSLAGSPHFLLAHPHEAVLDCCCQLGAAHARQAGGDECV
eukprot:355096-Chlamydomonas_euryale.AAC.4